MLIIKNKTIFFILLILSLTIIYPNYNQKFIIKNELSQNDNEYIVNYNDPILIKCKNEKKYKSKYLGGKFIKSENGYIYFTVNTLFKKSSSEKINVYDIEAIYIGNTRTWKELHKKWTLYLSLATIPGSIEMGNSPYVTEGFQGWPAIIINWSFFTMVSSVTYAPIIASIDFNKRKKNAIKLLIAENKWIIN